MNALLIPLYRGKFQLADQLKFCKHSVPEGFITDLDSVPRIPIFHLVFKGRTVKAAILHDYLYSIGHNRKDADKIFLAAMEAEGVRRRYRLPIYWAVRIFGKRYHHSKK